MREVLNAKDKRETIKRYIVANPELSNRRIAKYWDVSEGTIRNYKQRIGAEVCAENGQKVRKLPHLEIDNLPVIMPTDVEYDPGKIQDAMIALMDKICEMEKAHHYLRKYFIYQVVDAIEGTMILSGSHIFDEILKQTTQLYKEIVNERDARNDNG